MENSMKTVATLILLACAFAYAQATITLEDAVTRSIDGILSDTVNEGETFAQVKMLRGKKPSMTCVVAPAKNIPNTELAKCDVDFSVKITSTRPYLKCETSCFLIYKITNKDLNTLTPIDALESRCIENISSTDCQ